MTTFTRKHYEAIAEVVKISFESADTPEMKEAVADVAVQLAISFERDNSNFKRERFLSACKLYDHTDCAADCVCRD